MNYADTLRQQSERIAQPHYLVAPGEPPEITNDPELLAAREKLIRQIVGGMSWHDMNGLQRVGHALFVVVTWVFLSAVIAFVVGFALLVVFALNDNCIGYQETARRACENAQADFGIRVAFYAGVIGSMGLLAWLFPRREKEIRRLRGLSNVELLREHEAWRDQMRRLAAEEQHRRDLDYQAQRIAYWSDHYSRRG